MIERRVTTLIRQISEHLEIQISSEHCDGVIAMIR